MSFRRNYDFDHINAIIGCLQKPRGERRRRGTKKILGRGESFITLSAPCTLKGTHPLSPKRVMISISVSSPVLPAAAGRALVSRRSNFSLRTSKRTPTVRRVARISVRASSEEASTDDAGFEDRLSSLRGKRSKRAASDPSSKAGEETESKPKASPSGQRRKGVRDFTVVGSVDEPDVNWGPEEIVYEGPPARGEVFANVAMSWTIVWVPLTIAAVGRALWVNYKITDKVCMVDHLSLPFSRPR